MVWPLGITCIGYCPIISSGATDHYWGRMLSPESLSAEVMTAVSWVCCSVNSEIFLIDENLHRTLSSSTGWGLLCSRLVYFFTCVSKERLQINRLHFRIFDIVTDRFFRTLKLRSHFLDRPLRISTNSSFTDIFHLTCYNRNRSTASFTINNSFNSLWSCKQSIEQCSESLISPLAWFGSVAYQ